MNPQLFGDSKSPLYGVHHTPRRRQGPPRAMLLCPPLGHEYLRTNWLLRLLAAQLARDGVHVLRFDYFGTGDSSGNSENVCSIDTWVANISQAVSQLRDESAAEHVAVLGLRWGAILAARAATRDSSIHQLLLWEPVTSGVAYLEELRRMHRQMLDVWVCPMTTENSEHAEEILGFRYARSLVREIEGSVLQQELSVGCPVLCFADNPEQFPRDNTTFVRNDEPADWGDLRTIETAMLRPKTLRLIVKQYLASSPGPGTKSESSIMPPTLELDRADPNHEVTS